MLNRAPLLGALAILLSSAVQLPAQSSIPAFPAVPEFPFQSTNPIEISREVDPARPFSVIGPHGALIGQQDGTMEAWIFPWKVFNQLHITAQMENYDVPIDVNQYASTIDVMPNATVLTWSHANFTIRQIMFAPGRAPEGTGTVVFYQIEAIRPMTLTFSFTPIMQRMWPAASDPDPSPEWVPTASAQGSSSGFYILHDSFPDHAAALAMPGAEPGILAPYQERAHSWPLQFVLHYDPARNAGQLFPFLTAVGDTQQSASRDALAHTLASLDADLPRLYTDQAAYETSFLGSHTSIETPDKGLDAAFSWATVAIDQLRVETPERHGEAFTAGFGPSGDAARPGFGWFFGRDALWSLYAVDSYGDFSASREEFEFLLRHQRSDGKIMHEYAQTAPLVDWASLPYEYAAADSTPLLLMAANDYLRVSGDAGFIRAQWDGLVRAWNFETSHVSADGIYNNSQGTGWVESWVPKMPAQEIYLAALDEQASLAFADLARSAGHQDLAEAATDRSVRIRQAIEREYYLSGDNLYAFSRNPDGTTDATPTIFPSVAWWDGDTSLEKAGPMMRRWASDEFSTDWGTRILSNHVSFYDPISYHQGSMWPLFTGWVSVAEYRARRPLAGYTHLMQNAGLTDFQDLGFATELLSGQFFQVLGRSTPHQLWSSAMVISPVLRGLFGLEWDAAVHTLTVSPQLPAQWNTAVVRRIPLGRSTLDLAFVRQGASLIVTPTGAAGVRLTSRLPGARMVGDSLRIPLPAVEVAIDPTLPPTGSDTRQMKILDEDYGPRTLTLALEGQGGSQATLQLRENAPGLQVRAQNATIGSEPYGPAQNGLRPITFRFPAGAGYVTQTVTFSW
jgi:hypothetical protein